MSKTNNRSEELINKFISKKLSHTELIELKDALENDTDITSSFIKANEIREVLKALEIDQRKPGFSHIKGEKSKYKKLYKIAASIFIPLILGVSTYLFWSSNENSKEIIQYEVACDYGQNLLIELSDGSAVTLHGKSTLTYPDQFYENERNVTLDGEATFKVNADKSRPFYVNDITNKNQVMAYGTEFRVINYQGEDKLYIYLKEGKVDFFAKEVNSNTILNPGYELSYSKSNHKVDMQEASDKYLNIEKGIFKYKNETLEKVVMELNRRYQTSIQIESEELKHIRFTGAIRNESLTDILNIIKLSTTSIQWKEKDGVIIIY